MEIANVKIHASQFPENVRRDLAESLRVRKLNHKFLYDSFKQTQKWLALHEAHSPARTDKNCLATYEHAFAQTVKKISVGKIHVVGLGCGGGQKDLQLLKLLRAQKIEVFYTPSDVSVAMTLVARKAALKILPPEKISPFVCDVATAKNLSGQLITRHSSLITFFGMIPNFEPNEILPKLAALVRKKDFLLFSANLAPGKIYSAGVQKILPQYDNALTRDWLLTFLFDLGIERNDGDLRFTIETGAEKLKRVVVKFHFSRARKISVEGESFSFRAGNLIRLFFSYRYTPELVEKILARHGLHVEKKWITNSGEEGIFLCRKNNCRKLRA
jgi:L-histidine N-alpha-methyltransferase